MRALALWTGLLPAGLSGCVGKVDGGGEPEDGNSEVGKLDFGLIIGDGIALGNVRYTITQLSDGFFQMANVPDSELKGEGFGVYLLLPPALDYHLLIEAELPDGGECSGESDFDIHAGQSTMVDVSMRCQQTQNLGSARISAKVNVCPEIKSATAQPSEQEVGDVITLHATAADADEHPNALSYAWNSAQGVLGDSGSDAATLMCTETGDIKVNLVVSDGDSACNAETEISVRCVPAPPPPQPKP